jgi:hypothetical protein
MPLNRFKFIPGKDVKEFDDTELSGDYVLPNYITEGQDQDEQERAAVKAAFEALEK